MRGPTFASGRRLDGRTAVITGGNAGIGYETAKDMCRRGARVLILCRDRNRYVSLQICFIRYRVTHLVSENLLLT